MIKLRLPLACIALLCVFSANLHAKEQVVRYQLEPYSASSQRIGELDFYRTYQYSFKSSGLLTQLNVDVGQAFNKGDVLAAVDTHDLVADLNRFQADKEFVNKEVKRLTKLAAVNAVSTSELERFKSRSSQLKASITRTKEYLRAAKVIAPYDGTVVSRQLDAGEWVAPGQAVLEVAPLIGNQVVSLAVTEEELSNLQLGNQIVLTAVGDGTEYAGQIKTISSIPDDKTGLFAVEVALMEEKVMPVGKLFRVTVDAKTQFVFKVPAELVNMSFNSTVTLNVMDNKAGKITRRFDVVAFDMAYVYLHPANLTELRITK